MTSPTRRLLAALALSLALHGLPFVAEQWPALRTTPSPAPRPSLVAELRAPPPLAPPPPPLLLPDPPKPGKAAPPPPRPAEAKPKPTPQAPRNWVEEVKKQFHKLDEAGEFYPREAIAQGLQGEAVVLLVLGEDGSAVAARIEQSSGHRLLDEAALHAARSLRSLPADAPRETLLPVRFRLR